MFGICEPFFDSLQVGSMPLFKTRQPGLHNRAVTILSALSDIRDANLKGIVSVVQGVLKIEQVPIIVL